MATMTPQRQASIGRKPSIIRNHSPYGTKVGPIVKQGFVQARVRAIEGAFMQANISTSQSPHESSEKSCLVSRHRTVPDERLHEEHIDQHSAKPDTPNLNSNRYRHNHHASSKKWHRSTSSRQSHSSAVADDVQNSVRRKVHSMLELHAQYSGSPHGGRRRYRDYSNLRRISAGSEIHSPQPLSPSRQPVNTNQHTIEDSGFWSEAQAENMSSLPAAAHRKSIAEELDQNLDVSQGQDEASTAWATREEGLSYSFPASKQSKRRSMSEEQPPTAGAPSNKTAYSQYCARSLPVLDHSATSGDRSAIDDELRLKRTRSRRQVPDNTLESTSESHQQSEAEPLPKLDSRPRAVTTNFPWRSTSDATRRTRMHSLAVERLSDRRGSATSAKALRAPLEVSEKVETEANLSGKFEPGGEGSSQRSASPPKSTKSQKRSPASRSSSIAMPRPLSRVWTSLSTWRLGLRDRRQNTSELAVEGQASRSATPTRAELPANEMQKSEDSTQQLAEFFHPATPTSMEQSIEAAEEFSDQSPQATLQEEIPLLESSPHVFRSATPTSIELSTQAGEPINDQPPKKSPRKTASIEVAPTDLFQPATPSSIELAPEAAQNFSNESLRESLREVPYMELGSADVSQPVTPNSTELPAEVVEQSDNKNIQRPLQPVPFAERGPTDTSHLPTQESTELATEAAERLSNASFEEPSERVPSMELDSANGFQSATSSPIEPSKQAVAQISDNSRQESSQQVPSPESELVDVSQPATPISHQLSTRAVNHFSNKYSQKHPQQAVSAELGLADVSQSATSSSVELPTEAAKWFSNSSFQKLPQQVPFTDLEPTDMLSPATPNSIGLPSEAVEQTSNKSLYESPQDLSSMVSEHQTTPVASAATTEPQEHIRMDPARRSEANETLMRLLRSSTPHQSDFQRNRIEELSDASENVQHTDHGEVSSSANLPSQDNSRPLPPTPYSAQRPTLSTACSHTSLRPSPARATTEVTSAEPFNWTPSPSHSQLPKTYSAFTDRYQVHPSSSISLHDRYRADESRAASPTPSESISVTGTSAYQSLQNSQACFRRSRWGREREQRIKRVKVVVSLDGGTDLVVDASVKPNREGEEEGWRVRESVRRWEERRSGDDGGED